MKKKIMIFAILIGIIAIFGGYNYVKSIEEKKAQKAYELQIAYERQNRAFAIEDSLNNYIYYHDSNYLNLQKVAVFLYVYKMDSPKYELSVQDIVDYFSKEYAEDGTLMVYDCPDSINDYLEWYYCDGSSKIYHFNNNLVHYLGNNGYDFNYASMEPSKLEAILPLVEESNQD